MAEASKNIQSIELPKGYIPSDHEEYMNDQHLAYFRRKLLEWREELLTGSQETLDHLRDLHFEPDVLDQASSEASRTIELRSRHRELKLIKKIDDALIRIENRKYGFCSETGEPIGLRRLEARPVATLSLEAQERRERMKKTHRDI